MAIRPAIPSDFPALTALWEASVRATHTFLAESDVQELKPQVLNVWLPAVQVTVFSSHDETILGFSGVVEDKLEMLFIAPTARGEGIGKALLQHAVVAMGVELVDVNEQNEQAVGFYKRMGFEVIGRSPLDGQGKPFPLLHMKLSRLV